MAEQVVYYTHNEIKFDQETATRHSYSGKAVLALQAGNGPFVTAVIGNYRATKRANGHDLSDTVSSAFAEAQDKNHKNHCSRQGG